MLLFGCSAFDMSGRVATSPERMECSRRGWADTANRPRTSETTSWYTMPSRLIQPAVPADKVDPASLEDYRAQEGAAYGFFVAHKYAGESDRDGKLNRKMSQGPSGPFRQLSLLTIRHLRDLVLAHCKHGLTLTDLSRHVP